MTKEAHTPGPWPIDFTGDGKRIIVGAGLVEGPRGYDLAEVYADDCDRDEAEANARLIAAAPDLLEACKAFERGQSDAPLLIRAAITKATPEDRS